MELTEGVYGLPPDMSLGGREMMLNPVTVVTLAVLEVVRGVLLSRRLRQSRHEPG